MSNYKLLPGSPTPLGASLVEGGVNFALFSETAQSVEVCLFDRNDPSNEVAVIPLKEKTNHVWHGVILGTGEGQLYGYRVDGEWAPNEGLRFNRNKLLLDPYAKAIAGNIQWHDSLFGYEIGHPDGDLAKSESNSAEFIPKSVVVSDDFNWENDQHPKIPYHLSVIYEMHVRGFSKLNPEIPEELRGTYAGIAHPASIKYLKELGVTAVELLPVQQIASDRHLSEKGLTNYWGYNSIGFFAPEAFYASSGVHGEQVREFKEMVKALHKENIEVIMDVVYNHTGEGNEMGPTLCFRGIDNIAYYRLEEDKRYYTDYTGTGNTLNAYQPPVLKLIMDSLRYWVSEMHVDGFRFDLAATLARELSDVNALSGFFDIIYQDPIISNVKLIAEPWDLGENGYMVGKFPQGWAEWNDLYRDCMRNFWRGEYSKLGEFGNRFTGSADLYKNDYRNPTASINIITAHDGFTLNDLVSYNEKHNEANLDDNQDGRDENFSMNGGAEGETEDPEINNFRTRQKKNFLLTLMLSQGVPMLLSGDEFGNTQYGNNNAYCQDNQISWLEWEKADRNLLDFTQKLIKFRRQHPVFCRRDWFRGWLDKARKQKDIAWFHPSGKNMEEDDWTKEDARSLMIYLNGEGMDIMDYSGEETRDASFLVCFNASPDNEEFVLPHERFAKHWKEVINTFKEESFEDGPTLEAGTHYTLVGRSMVIFEMVK